MKNLYEDELRDLRIAEKRSAGKDIKIWAQRLSDARGETGRLQNAFDRYEREKEQEISLLRRQLRAAEEKLSHFQVMSELDYNNEEDHADGQSAGS